MSYKSHQFVEPLDFQYRNDLEISNSLVEIRAILSKQLDRGYCNFEFHNNLRHNASLRYLKISHVLEGRETFVYQTCDLENYGVFSIDNYAIGVDLNEGVSNSKSVIESSEVDQNSDGIMDTDNVYDRIYVQFVINIDGNDVLFHHSYDQYFKRKLQDFFKDNEALSKEYLDLIQIRMFFDPFYNDYTNKDLRLRISISRPLDDSIQMVEYQKGQSR